MSLAAGPFEETKNLPVAFQGRFRALEPAAKLWLYDYYHLQQLKREHLSFFETQNISALELLWKVHFLGHSFMDDAPFFWMHYADLKTILGLDPTQSRFSYNVLKKALFEEKETNLRMMRLLLPYEYAKNYNSPANRSRNPKQELSALAAGLWVTWRNHALVVLAAPSLTPWNFLKADMQLIENVDLEKIEMQTKPLAEDLLQLIQHLQAYKDLLPASTEQSMEKELDLANALRRAGTTLKMLPSKLQAGEWISLHALNLQTYSPQKQEFMPVANFTSFPDEDFYRLRADYNHLLESAKKYYNLENSESLKNDLNKAVGHFFNTYENAYNLLAGESFKEATGKQLRYPTQWQLFGETLYYRIPLIEFTLLAYCLALILFFLGYSLKRKTFYAWALTGLLLALAIHTTILALRCFVLQRPPVSNMFETIVYVPWIAMLIGFGMFIALRHYFILVAACVASVILLILLKLTDVDARMENVQAVLDSQYWLIVHVLMIVGSYGVFIVGGVLGHFYLIACALGRAEAPASRFMSKCLLQTMYIGIALLIPGTILGGVWAAESWGRFWDWDPKESWAFISACVYVLIIHAYTFKKIHDYGLAVGSIAGLMAISFTWYGVNYILGTGLHSYGFGKGGELYYYAYLMAETAFILGVSAAWLKQRTVL